MANGQEMGHCGRKVIQFRRQGCLVVISLGLQVRDFTSVAVRHIIEKGIEVVFDWEEASSTKIEGRISHLSVAVGVPF